MEFTTVDRVMAKVFRDFGGEGMDESDAIERIGEALEFLRVPQVQEQRLCFLRVEGHEARIPRGFHMVLQLAKLNCAEPPDSVRDCGCGGDGTLPGERGEVRGYSDWTSSEDYKRCFEPIRLAEHTFFGSLVCRERQGIYRKGCGEEYTIAGTVDRVFRFSFREGTVALSYLASAVDPGTGYPLVPDDAHFATAVAYYVRWKMAEEQAWNGREGFARLAQESERLWLKYARQAKNRAKMPKSLDEHQMLLEQTHIMAPRHGRYYGYFGRG